MPRWLPLLPLLATGWMSCGDPPEPFEVPGGEPRTSIHATFGDGQPVADAAVLLDGEQAGRTDAVGQLTLEILPGQHQLELHLSTGDGLVSRVAQSLEIGTESQEVKVSLPRPVRMLEPLEVTTSLVHLTWERSKEPSFREYKVYANPYSPAFDETNGRLVYVGTDASRTDFRVTGIMQGGSPLVSANIDIYFRVFVLKDDGSLAGSNVLHVRTPRWDNERNFTRHYRLSAERTFAGAWPIYGLAYDGSALWFLYRQELGGYYDNDKLTLVQRDPETLQVLKEIVFEDYQVPRGMTWDGSLLWVYFDSPGYRLDRFNPATGARELGFMASHGTESLAWTGSHLLQSKGYVNARIERVDPVTGGIAGTVPNPFTQRGGHRATGIAYRPGELWVTDMWNDDIAIIDDAGVHIGVVPESSGFRHMTFMGEKLVGVTSYSQVHIMRIER
jgi:hypothetical protein